MTGPSRSLLLTMRLRRPMRPSVPVLYCPFGGALPGRPRSVRQSLSQRHLSYPPGVHQWVDVEVRVSRFTKQLVHALEELLLELISVVGLGAGKGDTATRSW